ncbi:MAG: 16S rRNA (cytosine(1402)-N(4))-methyltransferase RsmH, partial [SAR324 cluster bacterium]|nr:16S rRNA (cytosine(1402)-N(4))-methyltransferase RsmH [SAR324 cluster bacterium]
MTLRVKIPERDRAAPSSAEFQHTPVLLEDVLRLVPAQARMLADVTAGGGGHAAALLAQCSSASLFACDRDPAAAAAARERLGPFGERVLVKRLRFSQLHHYVLLGTVDFILADLGVSSHQLDVAERGFSFSEDGPLDMRMDPGDGGPTAAELVNDADESSLLEWFSTFGEERFARRIVKALLLARARAPIATTGELARLVAGAVPARFHRKGHHPATKVFQALRIAVNEELNELEALLARAPVILAPGGVIAVISFHSLEDRMVKERFRGWEQPCTCPPSMPRCV